MAELVDDDVVDNGQRGHEAFLVEMQITALGAGRPSVAKILDLDVARRHANLGREVRHALLNPRQAFRFVKSLEHLMRGILATTLDNFTQQTEPTVL